jgi:hypothetical protein
VLKQDCEGSLLEGRYVMNLWVQIGKMKIRRCLFE